MYDTTRQITIPERGVYDILRDMNEDIRELRDTQYEYQYETRHEIADIKQRLSSVEVAASELKQDVAVLKSDVSGLKEDMKDVKQELRELHGTVRELTGSIAGMQTRLNWWLVIAGILLAALQYFKG